MATSLSSRLRRTTRPHACGRCAISPYLLLCHALPPPSLIPTRPSRNTWIFAVSRPRPARARSSVALLRRLPLLVGASGACMSRHLPAITQSSPRHLPRMSRPSLTLSRLPSVPPRMQRFFRCLVTASKLPTLHALLAEVTATPPNSSSVLPTPSFVLSAPFSLFQSPSPPHHVPGSGRGQVSGGGVVGHR